MKEENRREAVVEAIRKMLFERQDMKYRDFHAGLLPTVDRDRIIGVRVPQQRQLAKELLRGGEVLLGEGWKESFLSALPHRYFEEVNLHGMLLGEEKDYDATVGGLDLLLPHVDNWATCDMLSPKAFKKKQNHGRLLEDIGRWLADEHPYTKRFAIEMLMSHYLDDEFCEEYIDWVVAQRSDHYYVRMMVAWYMATALAKQYEATLPYLERPVMESWTHNKTIQKAIESYRLTDEQKRYLRGLKV